MAKGYIGIACIIFAASILIYKFSSEPHGGIFKIAPLFILVLAAIVLIIFIMAIKELKEKD